MLSATYPSCINEAKDVLSGSAEINGDVVQFGFIADFSDSMAMIKKYVFDKKEFTLGELVNMLDANFEGYENIRRKLVFDRDKYGNNKELPDFFAKDISDFLAKYVCGRNGAKERKSKWNIGFHVSRMSYIHAPKTASSPNGRIIGEELSKSVIDITHTLMV